MWAVPDHEIRASINHGAGEPHDVTARFAEVHLFCKGNSFDAQALGAAVEGNDNDVVITCINFYCLGGERVIVRGMELYKGRLIAYSLGNFATYYGISVEGIKGLAPILIATLNGNGEFVEGKIHSTIQLRPDGPSIDADAGALNLIRSLSLLDFTTPGILFNPDGSLLPAPRIFGLP